MSGLRTSMLLSLFSVLATGALSAAATQASEQYALTEDGKPSDVSASVLDEVLSKANLRKGIQSCVSQVYAADTRTYGTLRFSFSLYPAGGIRSMRFTRSRLANKALTTCIEKVFHKRLHGRREGVAAFVSGKIDIEPGHEKDFGFSISARLSRAKTKALSSLKGSFWNTLEGPVSMCPLGHSTLIVRLTSTDAQTRRSLWFSQDGSSPLVEQCLLDAEKKKESKSRRRSRRSHQRAVRRMTAECLKDVLKSGGWQDKAYAAEEIASNWRYRARRAIGKTIRSVLRSGECDGLGLGVANADSDSAPQDDPAKNCYVVPPGSLQGHVLVRMLRAQLRLGLRPAAGVMLSLARHPDPAVRLRLVDMVMSRWLDGIPEGLSVLVHDPDARVSTRAQQVGCLRSDWESLHAFEHTLANPDPALRAMAVLYARACVEKDREHMLEAVRNEKEPTLKMLMLRALPVRDADLILEHAGPALFDPCPAVRYLALGLIARLAEPPLKLLKNLQKRERDPHIAREIERILSQTREPKSEGEQVWLIQKTLKKKPVDLARKTGPESYPVGKVFQKSTASP